MTGVQTCALPICPTVLPGRTACYSCFELRKQSLKVHYDEYLNLSAHLKENETLKHFKVHSTFLSTACNMACYEIMRIIARHFYPQTYNQVLSFNFFSMELEKKQVLKLPRCPICSLLNQKAPKERYERLYAGQT